MSSDLCYDQLWLLFLDKYQAVGIACCRSGETGHERLHPDTNRPDQILAI
ncbi:MAG TPA: hypothetical protein VHB01_01305 [Nitrosospira sp.]|nr:hypothetical protein [Nitrosospira sp.]